MMASSGTKQTGRGDDGEASLPMKSFHILQRPQDIVNIEFDLQSLANDVLGFFFFEKTIRRLLLDEPIILVLDQFSIGCEVFIIEFEDGSIQMSEER